MHWTGTTPEKQAMRHHFQIAERWALEHDRPLHLGEFGAYDAGDNADRVAWTAFVAREAESRAPTPGLRTRIRGNQSPY